MSQISLSSMCFSLEVPQDYRLRDGKLTQYLRLTSIVLGVLELLHKEQVVLILI